MALIPFPGSQQLAQQRAMGAAMRQQGGGGGGFSLNLSPPDQGQEMAMLMALLSLQQRQRESGQDYALQNRSLQMQEAQQKMMMDELRRERTRNLVGSVSTRADLRAQSGLRKEMQTLQTKVKAGVEDSATKLLVSDLKEKRKQLAEGNLTDEGFATFLAGDFNRRLEKMVTSDMDEWHRRGMVSAVRDEVVATMPAVQGNEKSSRVFGETIDRFNLVFEQFGPSGTAVRLDQARGLHEDLLADRRLSAESAAQGILIDLDNGVISPAEANRRVDQLYQGRDPRFEDIPLPPVTPQIGGERRVGVTKGYPERLGSWAEQTYQNLGEEVLGFPGFVVGGRPTAEVSDSSLLAPPWMTPMFEEDTFRRSTVQPGPPVSAAQALAAQALAGRTGSSFVTNPQGEAAGLNTASVLQALLADPRLREVR